MPGVLLPPTGISRPLTVPLARTQTRLLTLVRKAQSRCQPLQKQPVSTNLSQEWMRFDLPSATRRDQLRQRPDSTLQPVQLISRTARLLQHRKFAWIEQELISYSHP